MKSMPEKFRCLTTAQQEQTELAEALRVDDIENLCQDDLHGLLAKEIQCADICESLVPDVDKAIASIFIRNALHASGVENIFQAGSREILEAEEFLVKGESRYRSIHQAEATRRNAFALSEFESVRNRALHELSLALKNRIA